MNNAATLGWDVGGAHLKAALVDANGLVLRVSQQPCPLWRGLDHLRQAATLIMQGTEDRHICHAITMTGELADIFESREQGVAQLAQVMAEITSPEARIYAGRRGFVSQQAAHDHAAEIASANWHASAAYVGAQVKEALFIDIGSTTADFIPIAQGRPATLGYSDAERLRNEELVYTGVVRTPVMALARQLPLAGAWQCVAAEHFATMADVYRLSGELPAAYDMADTADGREKTPVASARRLARMVGCDLEDATESQWHRLALAVRAQQLTLLETALQRLLSRIELNEKAPLIGAGAGTFLVRELARRAGRNYVDVSQLLPHAHADWATICFPAYAVAWLAGQQS
jgi:probable H4MPT-linked C1 transfer pathway protein